MKKMKKILFITLIAFLTIDATAQQSVDPVIDNDTLMLKLDLTRGGAISYLSLSGSTRSIVNIADEGRYIQQSYYAGKSLNRKAEGQSPSWSPWSWNPIQVGDSYRNRAEILDFKKNGDTLYVKCIPMLWDMNNKPAEAEMEQWTILKGNVLTVRNRLTCHRTDTIYQEGILNDQELPAVYPISALKNLYSYFGDQPFTGASLSNPATVNLSSGFWGTYLNNTVTENWMAYVDDTLWGIGVYNPICTNFLAGMAGQPGGDAISSSTSYIAPVKKEILNKNSVYEYEYYLVVGTIDEIRSKIYQIHSSNPLIESITVKSEGEVETLNGPGNTLQMLVSVLPAVAKNDVDWSVDNPEVATIDDKGVLTAVDTGTVKVTATAKDGSGITGSKSIVITDIIIEKKNAWEFESSLEGWTSTHAGTVTLSGGSLVFTISGSDPYVEGPAFTTEWKAGELKYLWLRLKNQTTDNGGAVYMFPSAGGFFALTFPLTPNDTEFRDIFIDLTSNPQWVNDLKLSYFRLDPSNNASKGKVYVDFIRFMETVATGVIDDKQPDVNETGMVYPNPATNILFFSKNVEKFDVSIYDENGKIYLNRQIADNKLSVSALPHGIYFIKITGKSGMTVKKFVKQ
jgi:hypothetical protein